jgi:thiol-disulfide isomerase/thioredoxin
MKRSQWLAATAAVFSLVASSFWQSMGLASPESGQIKLKQSSNAFKATQHGQPGGASGLVNGDGQTTSTTKPQANKAAALGAGSSSEPAKGKTTAPTGAQAKATTTAKPVAHAPTGKTTAKTGHQTGAAESTLHWVSVKQGFTNAAASNKWLVGDVYTSWCGWCKTLDRETFSDPSVKRFLAASFVCMKVDAEDGGPGQELADKLRISGYPTILVFDPQGKLKGAIEGFVTAPEFTQKIKQIKAGMH